MSPAEQPPAVPIPGVPENLISESDALLSAGILQREPYLVLFPLGVALSWAGVLHWLLHALGLLANYRPVFHALTQVQGFLSCFAVGFLFTMIPRRTGSAPPSLFEMGVALVAPVLTTLAAWNGWWDLAQGSWLTLAFTIIVFAVRRFVGAESRRRPPNGFVWIPMALVMGIGGSLLMLLSVRRGVAGLWLHEVGTGLLLQGMFTGLVLGVGTLALPLMTRGDRKSVV